MNYIGVDLGGTNISVGLVDEDGNVLKKLTLPTLIERGKNAVMRDIENLCKKLIAESDVEIKAIGIGTPGIVSRQKCEIILADNLKFKNVKLKEELTAFEDIPIFIENDANCAAFAEYLFGAAKGHKNSITITLGTGVGGGVILNGKIFTGAFCGGTEIGHMAIVVNGEECTCGRRGCWEAYASATALIRDTRGIAARYPNSSIFDKVGGDIRQIDAKLAFEAADEGDPKMIEVIDKYHKYVAVGIANLINIFEPEVVVIGGGICQRGEKLTKPVLAHVDKMVFGGNKTEVVTAKLGNDAGIIGAAMLCKE